MIYPYDPLEQIKLNSLMKLSSGSPEIVIGIVDGPIELSHPALREAKISTATDSQQKACKSARSAACIHGTFITGMLCAKRNTGVTGICPECTILLRPVFNEATNDYIFPTSSAEELSEALFEMIDVGAKVINLSLGLSSSSFKVYHRLNEAYDYALRNGVIIVAAAGNQGNIGNMSLIRHQWLIPVAACNESGGLDQSSNFGPSIGRRGLMAPGKNITGIYAGGQYHRMTGTSFAAPFVTGAIALLWSLFPDSKASEIIYSILTGGSDIHRSVIPPLLDCRAAFDKLMKLRSY